MPGTDKSGGGIRKQLFAWGLAHCTGYYEGALLERKRALFAGLTGTVLEIGPGAGANLPLYPKGIKWIGIEPNLYMHGYLMKKIKELGMNAEVRHMSVEHMDLDDIKADAVVSTVVLCSVHNPKSALHEVLRALKSGGKFIFIEHVAAPPGTLQRYAQEWLRPIWSFFFDRCRPNRETGKLIRAAGFESVQFEHFRVPVPVVSIHIAGIATKGRVAK